MGNLDMIRKDDSEIKQAVQEEFKWDTRIKETDVGVEVNNGVVTLTGTVSSYAERMAAQEAAHFVAGVHDVANDIMVKAPGSPGRTDTEIAQAVRHALEWDVGVPHERIRSTVSDGVVNLEGNVNFLREREDAERAVRYLDGVCGVRNHIVISPSTVGPDKVRAMIEKVNAFGSRLLRAM
jgi:osmotically-inducible protein OsmY